MDKPEMKLQDYLPQFLKTVIKISENLSDEYRAEFLLSVIEVVISEFKPRERRNISAYQKAAEEERDYLNKARSRMCSVCGKVFVYNGNMLFVRCICGEGQNLPGTIEEVKK